MSLSSRRRCLLGVTALALGCGSPSVDPPPPPPPSVSILSPVTRQVLPAGQPIEVRFSVSGVDSSGAMSAPFRLGAGTTRELGVGKVVAFIDSSSPVAEANAPPSDAEPFRVPDGTRGDPAALLPAGQHRLVLRLYYNDGTLVASQGEGSVVVNVQ